MIEVDGTQYSEAALSREIQLLNTKLALRSDDTLARWVNRAQAALTGDERPGTETMDEAIAWDKRKAYYVSRGLSHYAAARKAWAAA